MQEAPILVDRTEYGPDHANFTGIRPALQAAVIKAATEAGLDGEFAAGYVEDKDYVWARWTSWVGEHDSHILVRAYYPEFHRDEAGHIERFIYMCCTRAQIRRGKDGIIRAEAWPTAPANWLCPPKRVSA